MSRVAYSSSCSDQRGRQTIIQSTWFYLVFDAAFDKNSLDKLDTSRNDENSSFPEVGQKFIFPLIFRVLKVFRAEVDSKRQKMIIFGISVIFSIEWCFAGLNLSFLNFLSLSGWPSCHPREIFRASFLKICGLMSMQFSMGYPNLKSDFWSLAVPVVFSTRWSKNSLSVKSNFRLSTSPANWE